MSLEAYRIQASMAMDVSKALAGLREMADAYKGILATQKAILDTQKQISAALGGAGSAARSFAADMERATQAAKTAAAETGAAAQSMALVPAPRLLTYQPQGTGFQTQGAPYGPGTALVPTGQSGRQWQYAGGSPTYGGLVPYAGGGGVATRNGFTMPPGSVGVPAQPMALNYSQLYGAAYGAQAVGNMAGGAVRGPYEAAAQTTAQLNILGQMKGQDKNSGFTPDRVKEAYDAAIKTQQDVTATYVNKNLSLIVQLMAITQDAGASIAMLPEMARAQEVFYGLGRDGNRDITAALQSAEMRGILFKDGKADLPAIDSFLKNMEAVASMSGGRYGPQDVYRMLKSAGVSGALMSDSNGFAEMMPFIQSLGPERAGTALRGFSQQFSAGRMSSAGLDLLTEMGIVQHPELVRKVGLLGQFQLKPGAMAPGAFEMANAHPEQFILHIILPAVQGWLEKQYGSKYTGADDKGKLAYESAAMQQLASRIPGGVFDSEAVRLAPLIARDVAAFNQASGGGAYGSVVAANPLMQMEGMKAAQDAAAIRLGMASMPEYIAYMKAMTAAMNALASVIEANPTMAMQITAIAGALTALAASLAVILPVILALKGVKGLIGSGVIGPAGRTLANAPALARIGGRFLGPIGLMIGAYEIAHDVVNIPGKVAKFWNDMKEDYRKGDWLGVHPFGGAQKPIVVNTTVNVDGKTVSKTTTKHMADSLNGPQSGTGNFDTTRGFTPTEH